MNLTTTMHVTLEFLGDLARIIRTTSLPDEDGSGGAFWLGRYPSTGLASGFSGIGRISSLSFLSCRGGAWCLLGRWEASGIAMICLFRRPSSALWLYHGLLLYPFSYCHCGLQPSLREDEEAFFSLAGCMMWALGVCGCHTHEKSTQEVNLLSGRVARRIPQLCTYYLSEMMTAWDRNEAWHCHEFGVADDLMNWHLTPSATAHPQPV